MVAQNNGGRDEVENKKEKKDGYTVVLDENYIF